VRPDATGNLRSVPENCIIYLSVNTIESFIALLSLAAAIICWRQTTTIYG
jgi:hypothetical protein